MKLRSNVRICLRHRYHGLCRTTFAACSMQVVCLHNHGIRPAAASTHPHADASANRPSYRRKDDVVTHTFSRFLVVPRRVSLLHCLDDYLAAGALNSRECLNNLSSIMSLPGDSVGRGASRTLDLSTVLFLLDIEPDTFLSAPVPPRHSLLGVH